MLSKTLLKLIDEAILPAIVVISGKIIGVAVVTKHLKEPFTLALANIPHPTATIINTYSNLFSFGAITLGLTIILGKAYFLHSSHIHPKIAIKLHNRNLTSVIETTYELFHKSIVWISYQWLLTLLFVLQAYWEVTNWGFALACLLVTIIFSSLFIIDVDRELNIAKT